MLINIDPLHDYLIKSFSKGATDVSIEPGVSPKYRKDGTLTPDEHPAVEQYELDSLVGIFGGKELLQRLKSGSCSERFLLHSPQIGQLRCAATSIPSSDQGFMVVVRLQSTA